MALLPSLVPGALAAAAFVHRDANLAIPHATYTYIPWDVEILDTHSMYDAASPSRVTAATHGRYHIFTSIQWAGDSRGQRITQVRPSTGSGGFVRRWSGMPGGMELPMPAEGIVYLRAGQYIEVAVYQDSGVSLTVQGSGGVGIGPLTLFGMHRIGA